MPTPSNGAEARCSLELGQCRSGSEVATRTSVARASRRWPWLLLLLGAMLRVSAAGLSDMPVLGVPKTVRAFAAAKGIPLESIERGAQGTVQKGDTVVALVAFRDGKQERYWLIRFVVGTPTAAELSHYGKKTLTFNGEGPHGTKILREFAAGVPVAIDIDTAGPFLPGGNKKVDEKHARSLIAPDLLGLGLDQACVLLERHPTATNTGGGVASAQPPTDAEQRTFVGLFPALLSFVDAVQKTPGLSDIMWEIARKPSVWSLVKSAGNVNLNLVVAGKKDLAATAIATPATEPSFGSQIHRLPLRLEINGQDSLVSSLFVVTPVPPLQVTAGVVGIAAEPPDSPGKHLEIRVVAARRAHRSSE